MLMLLMKYKQFQIEQEQIFASVESGFLNESILDSWSKTV